MNIEANVLDELLKRNRNKEIFTVYDITRILQSKTKNTINHDDVRAAVERNYEYMGFKRAIGYDLPFTPPPQVYYQQGQNICNYDPDALDPNKIDINQLGEEIFNWIASGSPLLHNFPGCSQIGTCVVTPPSMSSQTKPVYVYGLVEKSSGELVKNYSGRGGYLYLTKNGPSQILSNKNNPQDYKIVKYRLVEED